MFGIAILVVLSELTNKRSFWDIHWWEMLRETVTVSFGEGNSAVNAAWENGDFDRKQVTNNTCSDFFDNVLHTHSSYEMLFDCGRYRNI